MRDITDTTFEGDNTVLLQQVTKSLLAEYRSNPTAVDQVCKSNILFSDDDILLTSLKVSTNDFQYEVLKRRTIPSSRVSYERFNKVFIYN